MGKKKSVNPDVGLEPVNTTFEGDVGAGAGNAGEGQVDLKLDPLPSVFVNKSNLGEIKGALDDIVKKYLTDQSFKPSLLHPTVHLSLGYTSIIFALASSLYSFKYPFEESKPVLWIGVSAYFLLQGLLWSWKRWVEKGEVFSGKRRRVVKRIETDIVHVASFTSLDGLVNSSPQITHSPTNRPGSPTSPSTSSSPSFSSPISPPSGSDPQTPTSRSKSTEGENTGPVYSLNLVLSTTSNGGKSLIHKSRVIAGKGIGEFVDLNGGVEEGIVTRWLSSLLVDAGLPGAEEEGKKDE